MYTQAIADKICAGIARRVSLVRMCDNNDELPEVSTVYEWLRKYPEFANNYARAREDQAEFIAEELIEITDNSELDPADKRIRVDARKWLASKYRPKVYGDKITQELTGAEGAPLVPVVTVTIGK
jgi:hypothetical protein